MNHIGILLVYTVEKQFMKQNSDDRFQNHSQPARRQGEPKAADETTADNPSARREPPIQEATKRRREPEGEE
jgi:hypothetical protein